MKLYIDANGVYVATKAEAKHNGKGWHQVDVPTTDGRQALADYLNALRWSEGAIQNNINFMNDVTGDRVVPADQEGSIPSSPISSYSAQSLSFEEQWDKFPVATKLHYGAKALEAARDAL